MWPLRPHERMGLIPACAGQTIGATIDVTDPSGSSPRVRGRHLLHLLHPHHNRLIPACAGQTRFSGTVGNVNRAHPRVCGADSSQPENGVPGSGSSPRVRGRLRVGHVKCYADGLIPACAGQTHDWQRRAADVAGSSPRVRGRLVSPAPSAT